MIFEEVQTVFMLFMVGEVVTVTTEDDDLFDDYIIKDMSLEHLTIGCKGKKTIKKIPWTEISLIIQKGFRLQKELIQPRANIASDFMKYDEIEMVSTDVLSLKIPSQQPVPKRITYSDPFTIIVDYIKDVSTGRQLLSTPDNKLVTASSWHLFSGDKFGILSFDSEVIEVGLA